MPTAASTLSRFVGCRVRRFRSAKTKTTCRIGYGRRTRHLLTFPGRATDPKAVATKIAELHGMCNIKALAFDRWRIEDIKRELDAIGCGVELVPFGQGFKDLSPAVDVLERLVEQGKLRHDGHPVLKMAAANCRVEMDAAGNRKLIKRQVHRPHRPDCRDLHGDRHRGAAGAGDRRSGFDRVTDGEVAVQHATLAALPPA